MQNIDHYVRFTFQARRAKHEYSILNENLTKAHAEKKARLFGTVENFG